MANELQRDEERIFLAARVMRNEMLRNRRMGLCPHPRTLRRLVEEVPVVAQAEQLMKQRKRRGE